MSVIYLDSRQEATLCLGRFAFAQENEMRFRSHVNICEIDYNLMIS